MKDKRLSCGCHYDCTWTEHACDNPCEWPTCLTDAEHDQLLDEIDEALKGRK